METNRADINSVLLQMRQMQAQIQTQVEKPSDLMDTQKTDGPNFGEMMANAVNGVNDQQMQAKALATAYEKGDPSVDLTQVMISIQKASLSFEAMNQVRNRLVRAYEDIMNMPV
ncbi:MAG: flagellar hook-basal body complex protein FliE [Pseudomonadales bacterium]|nr:flagellar hook-basal body complex protein FliE [Pseudomonadales bacterium]